MRKCATRFKWRLGGKKKKRGAVRHQTAQQRERERFCYFRFSQTSVCVLYAVSVWSVCAWPPFDPRQTISSPRRFLLSAFKWHCIANDCHNLSLSAVCVCVEREIDFWPPRTVHSLIRPRPFLSCPHFSDTNKIKRDKSEKIKRHFWMTQGETAADTLYAQP